MLSSNLLYLLFLPTICNTTCHSYHGDTCEIHALFTVPNTSTASYYGVAKKVPKPTEKKTQSAGQTLLNNRLFSLATFGTANTIYGFTILPLSMCDRLPARPPATIARTIRRPRTLTVGQWRATTRKKEIKEVSAEANDCHQHHGDGALFCFFCSTTSSRARILGGGERHSSLTHSPLLPLGPVSPFCFFWAKRLVAPRLS